MHGESVNIEDANGNLAYEVIDVIPAPQGLKAAKPIPALAAIQESGYATAKKPSELQKKAKMKALLDRMQEIAKKKKEKVNESDDAFKLVAGNLKKKYGSGVLVGKEKPPAPTEAQKKEYKKKQEQIAKERAAEFAKDPSQGRYPPGFSNRGSD